jgi:hypothetical protein
MVNNDEDADADPDQPDVPRHPPKRTRVDDGYDGWVDEGDVTEEADEVTRYLRDASSTMSLEGLLLWWKNEVPNCNVRFLHYFCADLFLEQYPPIFSGFCLSEATRFSQEIPWRSCNKCSK